LVYHRIFNPRPGKPINFESDVEETLLDLKHRFRVREVRFDPYQMQASAQRMRKAGINMVEFPQSVPKLTSASQNLFELIKAQNIVAYRDKGLRLAVQRSVAVENPRGWRIAKEKASHKIDVVVALAQAALAAVQKGTLGRMRTGGINVDGHITWHDSERRTHSRIRWLSVNELGEGAAMIDLTGMRYLPPDPHSETMPEGCPRTGEVGSVGWPWTPKTCAHGGPSHHDRARRLRHGGATGALLGLSGAMQSPRT
jgi:Phage Terminase